MAGDPSDARRQRVLKHMNDGHKPELSHYLQHYASLSARAASPTPELRDMDFDRMIIRAGDGKDYSVLFMPPLSSWEDARARLVEMDATARAALGIDDVIITEYKPPTGFAAVVLGSIMFYFACFFSLPWITPGSTAWEAVESFFPGGNPWFRWVVKAIFYPVLAIHTVEAVVFDRTRMRRHRVPRWSKLWWQWEINCWMEGATSWQRIDALIASKRAEKEGKKH